MIARRETRTFLSLAFAAMALLAAPALGETTTITGTDGGNDSWNTASNWDLGVPSGAVDAIVSDGVLAQVNNAATPAYSGSLTLNANSTLSMNGAAGSENAAARASGITMQPGSKIRINLPADLALPPIELTGDASIETLFGASDWETTNISAITGAYTFTLSGFNGHNYNFNAANTFSELICNAIDRYNIHAKAAGSLGTGDVTINPRDRDGRSAQLYLDVADTIADTATLTLNGNGFDADNEDRITIAAGVDETVDALVVGGVPMAPGTYDNTEAWLSGGGTLTVGPAAEPSFLRGDADANGDINLTDGVFILNHLFLGGPEPGCLEAADADGSDDVSITDGIYILNFLFLGGPSPAAPWPDCGRNPGGGGSLTCETPHPACG